MKTNNIIIFITAFLAAFAHNIKTTDLIPARMAISHLANTLNEDNKKPLQSLQHTEWLADSFGVESFGIERNIYLINKYFHDAIKLFFEKPLKSENENIQFFSKLIIDEVNWIMKKYPDSSTFGGCFSKKDRIDRTILDYIDAMYDFLKKNKYNIKYKKHAKKILIIMKKIRLILNGIRTEEDNIRCFGYALRKFKIKNLINELDQEFINVSKTKSQK
ncbi:hypothetical protein KAH94_03330 [bacterium]|nr:hypothetical protein [bacterium]